MSDWTLRMNRKKIVHQLLCPHKIICLLVRCYTNIVIISKRIESTYFVSGYNRIYYMIKQVSRQPASQPARQASGRALFKWIVKAKRKQIKRIKASIDVNNDACSVYRKKNQHEMANNNNKKNENIYIYIYLGEFDLYVSSEYASVLLPSNKTKKKKNTIDKTYSHIICAYMIRRVAVTLTAVFSSSLYNRNYLRLIGKQLAN